MVVKLAQKWISVAHIARLNTVFPETELLAWVIKIKNPPSICLHNSIQSLVENFDFVMTSATVQLINKTTKTCPFDTIKYSC